MEPILPGNPEPSPDAGLAALRLLQKRLAARGLHAGLAIFFSTLVFACLPEGTPYVDALRKGGRPLAGALLAAAAFCWWRYVRLTRPLAGTGLGPSRSLRVRTAWALGGLLFSEGVASLVHVWTAWPGFAVAVIRPMGLLAILIGQWTHALAPADEIRPRIATTLFDHPGDDE
jgi:hypothetical protein